MTKQPGVTAEQLVNQAKGHIENLTPEQAYRELRDGAVVVDLREPEERVMNGVIPGAVHVPRGMLEFRADTTSRYHQEPFHPDRRTIVHCAAGMRSALAAETLQRMGYGKVAHIDGGFEAWKASGLPVEDLGGRS